MGKTTIDQISTLEMVRLFNHEDKKVAYAVEKVLPSVANAVEMIVGQLKDGGRMFYLGSGSGGKIAVLDASECPPTFGVDDEMVTAVLSGGVHAVYSWLEETEDNEELAICDLQAKGFQKNDILVAVTASGTTPYALSGIQYAKKIGAQTIGICCNLKSDLEKLTDLCIMIDVGDEVLLGSTRLKAGTAQKMVLNMLSSCTMIKLGKTYQNFMIEVRPINCKLRKRIVDIIVKVADVEDKVAKQALDNAEGNAKAAILMLKKNLTLTEAKELIAQHQGFLSEALGDDK